MNCSPTSHSSLNAHSYRRSVSSCRLLSRIVFSIVMIIAGMYTSNAQTLLAGWDFQTTTNGGVAIFGAPNTQTVFPANVGSGTLYLNGTNGSSTFTTAASGNQLTAFGGTSLNAGSGMSTVTTSPASIAIANQTANNKSIVFAFNMSGAYNLIVSYATQKSGTTGFTTQQWDYSTDAINWTPAQTIATIPTSFAVQTLATIGALNNVPTAYLRVTFTGASGTSGNNRLDNIQLNVSSPSPVVTSNTASGTVGIPFSYFISATNSPISYAASGLPSGLSLNASTGEISGTPNTFLSSTSIPISAINTGGIGTGTLTLNINKGNQIISFLSLPTKTYGDAPFVLSATGGASTSPIVFTSSDNTVASITGNTVTINGAGTCTITASQAGDANYLPATNVIQTLTVNQISQTISFGTLPTKLITDAPFTLTATGGSSGNPIVFTSSNTAVASIIGNTVTINGAGTTNITASQAGNTNYSAAVDIVQSLQVNLLDQVINFNALPSKLVTSPPFTLSATGGASGNPITFTSSNPSVAAVSGNTVTIVGAGVTTITASQAGNSIYNAATNVTQSLVVNSGASIVTYTFGTTTTPTANPTSGVPISNLTLSAFSQGNNANTTQTSIVLSTTSASNNSGSSGEMNAGITARNRNFQLDSSAYFEVILSPASGNTVSLNSLSFNSRSTGTGPTTLDIRCSNDNYASSIGTVSVLANSTWSLITPPIISPSSNIPMTIRIYGYVIGGSGSIGTGSSPNNWRIDDVKLNVSINTSYPCNLTVSAVSSDIICNGGSGSITVNTTNANGTVNYKLNAGTNQTSNIFNGVSAGVYTVNVTDAYLCYATTVVTLTEPTAQLVTASNVNGCEGVPVALSGFPIGGNFSISNPYSGSTTSFTYSFTDTNGCVSVSSPATVTMSACAVLNLKLFLQSYYIGGGLMTSVLLNQGVGLTSDETDNITVELYDASSISLVATTNAMLKTDGTAIATFPPLSGSYYIAIKHRNTLQTWSKNPITIGSTSVSYDFSNAETKAYGDNMISVDAGVWALYSGDIVQDDNIDLLDLPDVETDVQNFVSGYFATDVNGDGNVDLLDFPYIETNIQYFVYSNHPIPIVFPETMEIGVKSSYTIGDITLSTGSWNFDDALIGTSTSDHKNGARAARLQNLGKITMNFDVFIDSSVISISHAKYASESTSTWGLFSSINGGSTWVQEGVTITTSATSLQVSTFTVNVTGNIRFQIRKLTGGRLNIDDFNITANTGIIVSNDNDHIAFGNPSLATTDISFPDNYLLIKSQFDLAYNNSTGGPAWVGWHLDLSDVGSTPRCDCFATDVQIPSSFYRANSSSYSGSGFDRGHQVPSAQRNNNITNNAVTFLMSNMLPQAPNLNQVTWNNMEQYCLTLINSGYELYTYAGGYGSGGTGSNGGVTYTIDGGNINVPSHCWKIVIALPVGNNDVNRVTTTTRVIAVDMPNTQTVSNNTWGSYRTTIDSIETATGFDFLSILPPTLQNAIEAMVDSGPTN